jgi:hypothetical protein
MQRRRQCPARSSPRGRPCLGMKVAPWPSPRPSRSGPSTLVARPSWAAVASGLLNVDLTDAVDALHLQRIGHAGRRDVKPNRYRRAFIALANDWESPDDIFLDSS